MLSESFVRALGYVAAGLGSNYLLYLMLRSARRRRAEGHGGWRYLWPGRAVWVVLPPSLALIGLAVYCYVVFGSTRMGVAQSQTLFVGGLVFFIFLALCLAYSTAVERVRWNESCIERRTVLFQTRTLG